MPLPAAGFGRRLKLVNGDQFGTVFSHRKSWHGASFSTHAAPNDLDRPRLGLAVSRRVSKRAVERNRLKRLARESFRHQQHRLGSLDYVVVAKPSAAGRNSRELRAELDTLWAKARRKCEEH